ncbi:MAG: hypothetical protein F4X93_01375 [Proteobacteria bacterium]|nr:hypothetical protein [Pseudomonadota bacterium]
MKLRAALLLTMLAPLLTAAPESAEETPENTATPAARQGEDTAPGTTADRDTRRSPPLEEFVPSEEVSADRPVSFPTDI